MSEVTIQDISRKAEYLDSETPKINIMSNEHYILKAIEVLGNEAYGSDVAIQASKAANKRIKDGNFYGAINHLKNKNLITTSKQGKRAIHKITKSGRLAIQKAEQQIVSSHNFFVTTA